MSKKPIKKLQKTDPYNETFPTRLREVMEAQNITQAMLAAEVGVTRQSVAKYTSGLAQPNIEALQKIVNYLQVSGDYLIGIFNADSLEPNMNNACKYTGLSKEAIEAIKTLDNGDSKKPYLSIFNTFCEKSFIEELVKAFVEFTLFTNTGELTFSYTGDKPISASFEPKIMAEWLLDMELDRLTDKIKDTMLEKYSYIYAKEK